MMPPITITEHHYCPWNLRIFTVMFDGTPITVTVTAAASVVRKWLKNVLFLYRGHRHHLVVGMGVQWTPSDNAAEVLQLCIGQRCLIFQLYHANYVPTILRRFLDDPLITFVGIWNSQDAKRLFSSKHELVVNNILDLRKYVETDDGESLRSAPFETIVREVLGYEGVRLERSISMSDWDDEDLSEEQILQACVDAYVSFRIGRDIQAWKYP